MRSNADKLVLPKHRRGKGLPKTLSLNVVAAKEITKEGTDAPLEWIILTSEPISTAELTRKVLRNYELRWRIEDYHKAWESGVGVEEFYCGGTLLDRKMSLKSLKPCQLLKNC